MTTMEFPKQAQTPAATPESETEILKNRIRELEVALLKEQTESAEVIAHFQKQLERLGIDPLTETGNRLTFDHELDQALKMIHREILKEISLIFIDLDHFKNVNDTQGHLAGDEVLKKVAGLLKSVLRETDILTRYGGDEFAVLLPNTDENGAKIIAEKLRATLENDADLKGFGITASLGVCSTDVSNVVDPKTLTDRADTAAYASKERGRNQVSVYEEGIKMKEGKI